MVSLGHAVMDAIIELPQNLLTSEHVTESSLLLCARLSVDYIHYRMTETGPCHGGSMKNREDERVAYCSLEEWEA
jgi:hypothetical protein